jgi:mannitol/fructose-specific phosphotransferase system IIA component (Ntr-type)/nucleotide-binding universal stress UspA family protein
VLAVVAASTRGALDAGFWTRLVIFLSAYLVAVWLGLPRLARWFFRRERTGGISEYLFVFTALFAGAYLADLAGVEAIVGAFLVGIALNRLIPAQSLLTNRIHFVGEAIFIPFFLLSIGMLVDVRVLAGNLRVWEVMIAMTVTVTVTKWMAARLAQRIFGYSGAEGWTIFGLSVPQAAATLAATLIGIEVGLFDEAVLNGAVMMILVTCIVGPWVVERYGRSVALQEEQRPYDPSEAPKRILVPMANPATADDLMDLALVIRDPGSPEPVYPLTVVPADEDRSGEFVATAEKMLSHAVAHATGADVPVVPLTRVDHNFANGIARGMAEIRASTLIIGWDGKQSHRRGIFGSVLDQLLEQSKQQVLVTRIGHPLNTTQRILLLIPHAADHVPGFAESVKTIKQLANRLGAQIIAFTVAAPPDLYRSHLDAVRPEAPVTVERLGSWNAASRKLVETLRRDDLVVVLSARRGSIAWDPALERLPSHLARMGPESFIMMYPAEVAATGGRAPAQRALPHGLDREQIVLRLEGRTHRAVIRELLHTREDALPDSVEAVAAAVERGLEAFTPEIQPGIIVPHARLNDLVTSQVFLGTSQHGVAFPGASEPAHVVFLVLTPEDHPQEHLNRLSEIARLVGSPGWTARVTGARTVEEILSAEETAILGRAGR